jgi:hypothetical protein
LELNLDIIIDRLAISDNIKAFILK